MNMTIKEQLDLMLLISQESGHRRDRSIRRFKELTGCTLVYANQIWLQLQNEVGATEGFGGRVMRYLDTLEDAMMSCLQAAQDTGKYEEFIGLSGRMESALGLGVKANVTVNQTNTQINTVASQLASMSTEELKHLASLNTTGSIGSSSPARIAAPSTGGAVVDVLPQPGSTGGLLEKHAS